MKFPNRKSILPLLAGAALYAAGASAGSLAGEAVQTRTETVKYAPSRAATVEGASALYGELKLAAQRVCADSHGAALLPAEVEAARACVADALDKAVRKVGIPMLTVLHQQGSEGRSPAVASR